MAIHLVIFESNSGTAFFLTFSYFMSVLNLVQNCLKKVLKSPKFDLFKPVETLIMVF